MVAFYTPKVGFKLSEEYLWSMNFGDHHSIQAPKGAAIQIDYRGLNPEFSQEELNEIKKNGFVRADTNWYALSPEPDANQRGKLQTIFTEVPSTTIIPNEKDQRLKISFVIPLSDEMIEKISRLGISIESIDEEPIAIRPDWQPQQQILPAYMAPFVS